MSLVKIKAPEGHTNGNPIKVADSNDWVKKYLSGQPVLGADRQTVRDDAKWLADRKTAGGRVPDGFCIGASSAAAVAGIYPGHENGVPDAFNGKLSLYCQLTGRQEAERDTSAMEAGNNLEGAVAAMALDKINEEYLKPAGLYGFLVEDKSLFQCGILDSEGNLAFPHVVADIDRLIELHKFDPEIGVDNDVTLGYYGLEIKTTRKVELSTAKWKIDSLNVVGCPEPYEVQTRYYMGVMNLPLWFIAVAPRDDGLYPQNLLVRKVERDKNVEIRILNKVEQFAVDCSEGKVPSPDDDTAHHTVDAYAKYGIGYKEGEKPFDLDPALGSYAEELSRLDWEEKQESKRHLDTLAKIKADKEEALSHLLPAFDKADNAKAVYTTADGKKVFLSIDEKTKADGYDEARLKTERPDLWDKGLQPSMTATGFKTLKKEAPALYDKLVKEKFSAKPIKAAKADLADKTDLEQFAKRKPTGELEVSVTTSIPSNAKK